MAVVLSTRQLQLLRYIAKNGITGMKLRKTNQLTLWSLLYRGLAQWSSKGLDVTNSGEKVLREFSVSAAVERKTPNQLARRVERLLVVSRGVGQKISVMRSLRKAAKQNA